KVVRVTQLATGKELRSFPGAPGPVSSVAVNGNATLVAAGTVDRNVLVWNAGDGKLIAQRLAHGGPVTRVSVPPPSTQLLTAGADGLLKVWALPLVPGRTLAHPDAVLAAATTPDGKKLYTAGADKVVRSWDLTKNVLEKQFPGHRGPVTAVA